MFTDTGAASFGGVMRDHLGEFLTGFYGDTRVSCITYAEILGLYNRLPKCD